MLRIRSKFDIIIRFGMTIKRRKLKANVMCKSLSWRLKRVFDIESCWMVNNWNKYPNLYLGYMLEEKETDDMECIGAKLQVVRKWQVQLNLLVNAIMS